MTLTPHCYLHDKPPQGGYFFALNLCPESASDAPERIRRPIGRPDRHRPRHGRTARPERPTSDWPAPPALGLPVPSWDERPTHGQLWPHTTGHEARPHHRRQRQRLEAVNNRGHRHRRNGQRSTIVADRRAAANPRRRAEGPTRARPQAGAAPALQTSEAAAAARRRKAAAPREPAREAAAPEHGARRAAATAAPASADAAGARPTLRA